MSVRVLFVNHTSPAGEDKQLNNVYSGFDALPYRACITNVEYLKINRINLIILIRG